MSDARTTDAWLLVPAYREAAALDRTLRGLCRRYANVVVVDDGSDDGTYEVALRHPVHALRHAVNRGQGAALQTALDHALAHGARYVVTFDADGQHAAADVEALLAPLREGRADVALGSRFLGRAIGMPRRRRLLLRAAVAVTRRTTGLAVTDVHNGLRAFTREAASRLRITQDRMAHASELLDQVRRLGLRFVEVPVTIRYTPASLRDGQTDAQAFRILGELLVGRVLR